MVIGLDIFLVDVSSLMRIDVMIWVAGIPVVFFLLVILLYQVRQYRQLKVELVQLAAINRHSIEYELVLKAMKLSTWRIDVAEGVVSYESDYRSKTNSFVPQSGATIDGMYDLIHIDDRDTVREALTGLMEGKYEDYHQKYRAQASPSSPFYWEETFATIDKYDIDGNPLTIVGTSMRIDEQKEIEQALIDARNHAEESDRLKSAFLANITHEVRTPLNAIVGFSDVLPMAQSEEERNELIKLIKQNNAHLLRLFDDMMNISKLEAGNQGEIVKDTFELTPLFRELADKYLAVALDKGLSISLDETAEPVLVHTDRDRLKEILNQYMNNAVKFTSTGGITLGSDKKPSSIRIWVRDTGKGIPADKCNEHLFERFVKVDDFVAGTGLGLSICRSLADVLGGQVGVESVYGQGSTFWVEIPL
jgi:signal transduction histidine kinase